MAVFDVKDYGAVADGVIDDAPAVMLAISAAVAAGGGVVSFPTGNFCLGSTITISSPNVAIRGEGRMLTKIFKRSDYGDVFLFTGNDATGAYLANVEISGLSIWTSVLTTSGYAVKFNGVSRFKMADVFVDQGYRGFGFFGALAGTITETYIHFTNLFGGSSSGRMYALFDDASSSYGHPHCADLFFSNYNYTGNGSVFAAQFGIYIKTADGIWFSNGRSACTTGGNIVFDASGAHDLGLVWFNNHMTDAGGTGVVFNGSSSYYNGSIQFSNCNFKAGIHAETWGVLVQAGAKFSDVHFSDCVIWQFGRDGVNVSSADFKNWSFDNCDVHSNSLTTPNSSSGYSITGSAGDYSITGGSSGGRGGQQKYGIYVSSGSGNNRIISGVRLTGNATGKILDGATGTNKSISGNI